MSPKYWIKLYHEVLIDPKICRLSDKLYRRVIELFLLAGRLDKDGLLPSVDDIAYALRLPLDETVDDLAAIAGTGIIEKHDEGWVVVRFAERQAPMEQAERMRRNRLENHRQQYYGDVPVTPPLAQLTAGSHKPKTEEKREEERREEAEETATAQLFQLVEGEGIMLNSYLAERYQGIVAEGGIELAIAAVQDAIKRGVRPMPNYVAQIVTRCVRDGREPGDWGERVVEGVDEARAPPAVRKVVFNPVTEQYIDTLTGDIVGEDSESAARTPPAEQGC